MKCVEGEEEESPSQSTKNPSGTVCLCAMSMCIHLFTMFFYPWYFCSFSSFLVPFFVFHFDIFFFSTFFLLYYLQQDIYISEFFCHPCDVYDMKKPNGLGCEARQDAGKSLKGNIPFLGRLLEQWWARFSLCSLMDRRKLFFFCFLYFEVVLF